MAQDDIRLRQTVEQTASPTVELSQRKITPIDANKVLDVSEKFFNRQFNIEEAKLTAAQKAKAKADHLRLTAFENALATPNIRARAVFAETEGENVHKKYDELKTGLSAEYDKLVDQLPNDLRDQGKIRVLQAMNKFESSAIPHYMKELDRQWDDVHKARAAGIMQDLIINSAGTEQAFDASLNALDNLNKKYAAGKGMSKEVADALIENSRSDAVHQSIKNFETLGDMAGAQRFLKRNAIFLNAEDKIKVQRSMQNLERTQRATRAQSIVSQALSSFPDNPDKAREAIKQATEGDGELYNESISMFTNEFNYQEKRKKEERENTLAEAKSKIRNNGRLTPDILKGVDPKDQAELVEYGVKVSKGETIQTDHAARKKLDDLYQKSPEKFAEENLDNYVDKINASELRAYRNMKKQIIDKDNSRRDNVRFSTSKSVSFLMDEVLQSRGIYKLGNEEQYYALRSLGHSLYQDILEANPDETDRKVIEREFERAFRRTSLPVEIVGGITVPIFGRIDLPFVKDIKKDFVTQQEALDRIRNQEPILPIENAEPQKVEQIRKALQKKYGREATEEEVQRTLDSLTREQLRLE